MGKQTPEMRAELERIDRVPDYISNRRPFRYPVLYFLFNGFTGEQGGMDVSYEYL